MKCVSVHTFQFFDISTTVDPSYVISLIRKLLPANASNNHNSHGDVFYAHVQGLDTDHTDKTAPTLSGDRLLHVSNDGSESMEIADDFHKSASEEGQNNSSYDGAEQCGHSVPVEEEAWEEYGCILWDLAASKTHAELMVRGIFFSLLLISLDCFLFNLICLEFDASFSVS